MRRIFLRQVAGIAAACALLWPTAVLAQASFSTGTQPASPGGAPSGPGAPGASLVAPGGAILPAPGAIPPMAAPPPAGAPPAAQLSPMVPAGQVALMVSARYGKDLPAINAQLQWRVFADRPDAAGTFRLVREDRGATPTFMLPPGGYVVHVAFGHANLAKRVQLRSDTVRETFELQAGAARFEGRVGDARIQPGQISFDIFKGSQFDGGAEKRPIIQDITAGDVVLLPEGTYNVVSTYGDGNAMMRADVRVQVGKLTETTITHRAAKITLKLVNDKGGEALASTAWSVLTPGGDVIKESIGAFPTVILSEGDYIAIARNEGKMFRAEFKVEPGFDREIEVLVR